MTLVRSSVKALVNNTHAIMNRVNFSTEKLGEKGLAILEECNKNSVILQEAVKSIIPPLTYDKHKGQDGRLATIGGCQEYTGAPYFAAISALKIGCDLSHVFCTKDAAPVIKSYSPELIVHPVLDKDGGVEEINNNWLPRMHSLIIGPGLGRHPRLLENTAIVIKEAKELNIPLVIDADGVYLLSQSPELIHGYTKAILTPNIMEFKLLYKKVIGEEPDLGAVVDGTMRLCQKLGNVTIVNKGACDIITDGKKVLINSMEGSPRRCGGQGDLLSGSMGTMTFWAHNFYKNKDLDDNVYQFGGPTMIAAYGASLITRTCAKLAFAKRHRSMTTTDMIAEIFDASKNLFE
ncbi:ATP-dependent (S)-NAD(P)H-hydrate dehydratase-like [Anneissia japonica]|uniref:ATP-dependent (S)-NAD(P)H-hydrate dehydratase-like n=1 Tax=Anneissia japonica TaxID=1529436 RepID=UPI00142581F7|nr:ATP-dependent (S)-NAD(P)H-hydrate dehydratase-like [Anneissia japonica]